MKIGARIIAVVLLAVTLLTFCACGKKFVCDFCEKEKSGKQYEYEFLGEKLTICSDCYKGLKELEGILDD
ncbi:MAG: hypothetical protein K5855_05225 [Oscillospiraceae bacterium]|nr:hypothetical protein [Oscillospiraceae bacterium]